MTIMDAKLVFSEDQDIHANVGANNDSENVPDLGIGKDGFGVAVDPGVDEEGESWLNIQIGTSFAGAGSVVTITLVTDDNLSFSSPTTLRTYTTAVGTNSAAGDFIAREPMPAGLQRYAKLNFAVATANLTAGVVNAYVSRGAPLDV